MKNGKFDKRLASWLIAGYSLVISCYFAELLAGVLRDSELRRQSAIITPYRAVLSSPVGYANLQSITYRAAVGNGDKVCYDVTYTLDEYGRRIVSNGISNQGPTFLLLGDSITFGSGLLDSETWQYVLAQQAPVLNYSVFGYGPQHVLAQLQSESIQTIREERLVALWTLIPVHLFRSAGGDINTPFWEESPYYVSNGADLKLLGSFKYLFPIQTYLEQSFSKLELFHLLVDAIELYKINNYAAWTARIVIEGQRVFQARFSGRLIVVLHPMWNAPQYQVPLNILKEELIAGGIQIIDLSNIPYTNHDMIGKGCDYHPGAVFTKRYAELLFQELQKAKLL